MVDPLTMGCLAVLWTLAVCIVSRASYRRGVRDGVEGVDGLGDDGLGDDGLGDDGLGDDGLGRAAECEISRYTAARGLPCLTREEVVRLVAIRLALECDCSVAQGEKIVFGLIERGLIKHHTCSFSQHG